MDQSVDASMAKSSRVASDYTSFFRAHYSVTVRSVQSVAGTAAEDVAQEAFAAALAQWSSVAVLDRPDLWVRLVARRIAWRWRSRESRRWSVEATLTRLSDATEDRDLALDVRRATRDLPLRQRAAIKLYYLADKSVSDVALILDCSESAAKIWLHRARERLADSLLEHRGRWVSEGRWNADAIGARMRATGDKSHIPTVLSEVSGEPGRWAFTLERGNYLIEDAAQRLDWGTYRVQRRSIIMVPWNRSGQVTLSPTIDAARARYRVLGDTTAPTSGVPDDVYLRLLLEADSFRLDARSDSV